MIGLEPTNELGHPFNGIIPVTPVMDTQLDDIVIRDLLIPLTQRLLKNLKAKMDERKTANWLEIYLAMFVVMSNMEWVMKDLVAWTNRHGLKVCLGLHLIRSSSLCWYPSTSDPNEL
jgi:hypothetical protein